MKSTTTWDSAADAFTVETGASEEVEEVAVAMTVVAADETDSPDETTEERN